MSGPGDDDRIVVDTRRRRTREEKLAIVGETRSAPVSRVARKHGVASGLVFRWRKQFARETAPAEPSCEQRFVAIALPAPVGPPAIPANGCPTIEIVLTCGRRVIVGKDVDTVALKRVIAAVEA